nr:hypothetical protein Q903MT_gene5399 [Picea sitchensis]
MHRLTRVTTDKHPICRYIHIYNFSTHISITLPLGDKINIGCGRALSTAPINSLPICSLI